ncbi:hypothetical protein [Neolewinella persica]|uniref:hypothetical protein n=1 Tax=Neolewinella persica TaxID=70998 RepID=UPI0003A58A7B|nr:hypothetical protein [Neolewinella persica]
MMNSFLLLQNEDTGGFVEKYQDQVRKEVESRVRTVHLISDLVELFFPKLADTATVLLGGEITDLEELYLTIEEGSDQSPPGPPPQPGGVNGDDIIR